MMNESIKQLEKEKEWVSKEADRRCRYFWVTKNDYLGRKIHANALRRIDEINKKIKNILEGTN